MYDELTRADLQKMQEEIDYRVQVLRPKLIEDVQTARAFGDLSENFEYKCAKQDKNRNDHVESLMENTGKKRTIQLVTTLRQDALKGLISKESPVGKAILGHRAGERVEAHMENGTVFFIQILSIEKGKDDGSIPIGSF